MMTKPRYELTQDFHPLDNAHTERTTQSAAQAISGLRGALFFIRSKTND